MLWPCNTVKLTDSDMNRWRSIGSNTMQNFTFIAFMVSEKITRLKFLCQLASWPNTDRYNHFFTQVKNALAFGLKLILHNGNITWLKVHTLFFHFTSNVKHVSLLCLTSSAASKGTFSISALNFDRAELQGHHWTEALGPPL